MIVPDTLVCNIAKIAALQSNPAYDYSRDLSTTDSSSNALDWLGHALEQFFSDIFGSHTAAVLGNSIYYILIFLGILLISAIILFIYHKKHEWFVRNRKDKFQNSETVDTIYGVDFDNEIAKALRNNNYYEASRLLYLQTLRHLNEAGRISWQFYKTPTQYLYEFNMPAFREITTHFLRIRYGNFAATNAVYNSMKVCQTEIEKGEINEAS